MMDLIIIGGGPAGLSAAVEAKKNNINAAVFEKGNLVNSITRFPTDMVFFSTSELLEIGGLPFNSNQIRPTRREAVRYYQQVARYFEIDVKPYYEFMRLDKSERGYRVFFRHTITGHELEEEGRHLLIATGYYDVPKRLNIPGEDLPHVSHYYHESFPYHDQDVVVIGAGNSAVEAALEIFRSGGRVTMVHRGDEINKSVKYWIMPDILNRIREGSINLITNARVQEILANAVIYNKKKKSVKIKADHVLALIGYQPDQSILERSGAAFNTKTLEPEVHPETFESSRPGLYFGGSILSGIYSNRIFIENSRSHGEAIVKHIMSKKR